MAATKKNTGRKSTASRSGSRGKNSGSRKNSTTNFAITNEVVLIGVFAVAIILFLCNFGIIGPVGDAISSVLFGIFGLTAYVAPVFIFVAVAFGMSNKGNVTAIMKLCAGILLFCLVGALLELLSGSLTTMSQYSMVDFYTYSAEDKSGGGILGGSLAYLLYHYFSMVGTILVMLVLSIICVVIITERSFLGGVKKGSRKLYESAREDAQYRRELSERRREEAEARRQQQEEEKRARREAERLQYEEERARREEAAARRDAERILRMDRKATGVITNITLAGEEAAGRDLSRKEKTADKPVRRRDDVHEITINGMASGVVNLEALPEEAEPSQPEMDFDKIRIRSARQMSLHEIKPEDDMPETAEEIAYAPEEAGGGNGGIAEKQPDDGFVEQQADDPGKAQETAQSNSSLWAIRNGASAGSRPAARLVPKEESATAMTPGVVKEIQKTERKRPKKYIYPPLSLLKKGNGTPAGDSERELRETAARLQQTLKTFGVQVTITDISQGPTVTRYELQPQQGVKVSKIVGLSDDIKLNLAATDIRIEAPIPGKAAIGIEVPNKETMAVGLRDLLETKNFKDFPSKIAFAVGKDLAGQTVVADIAKMPHMLIAGATGSGKSVCINTLIMSILYKAHPDEVKLILVDPKVVELSVYNGIPHLLIPVVTDPKKASAALHWGVAEMTDRYKKFADFNVRDLKGYNKRVEEMQAEGEEAVPAKMPQIVIIVDELADLMMVSPGEVEESICRLAQLARAAGIHLIIATQRPSVDVITGLIKANMPSRVAFSVSSGVDSRTILDMNGAEKLLGKGDMLFYPQGYTKPVRVQGAFVSDGEVSAVVDFLKNQAIGNIYDPEVEEQMKHMSAGGGSAAGDGAGPERDAYFEEAGKFIIDKDKASIGMLQRVFKIGFNRAARIMDQLAEAGVVGEEEGTKPRKVLMSMEQFEQYLEN